MPDRKAKTAPPKHGGPETKIRLSPDLEEAIYINGVWISPGEEAWVEKKAAARLVKDGDAEKGRVGRGA